MGQNQGNGSGKFNVVIDDQGGWIRVFVPDLGSPPHDADLPLYLAHAMTAWFRTNPHLRLRFAMPVTRDGETVELLAWYDQHLFPDTSSIS
jgi:hypothetical protein